MRSHSKATSAQVVPVPAEGKSLFKGVAPLQDLMSSWLTDIVGNPFLYQALPEPLLCWMLYEIGSPEAWARLPLKNSVKEGRRLCIASKGTGDVYVNEADRSWDVRGASQQGGATWNKEYIVCAKVQKCSTEAI